MSQFSSVQDGIYALGKAHMCSISDGDDLSACGEGVQEVTGVVPGREPPPLCLHQVSMLVLGVHASADLNF